MNRAQHQRSPDNDRCDFRYWHEWIIDDEGRTIVLCVETDLEMEPGAPDHDPRALEELISHAQNLMRSSASAIDHIRLVPSG